MGLFDFLKKKEQPQPSQKTKRTEPYLGDLEKTGILFTLLETPVAERDDSWQKSFLANIPQASFRCGEPQVITGPDGFLYFQLLLPEPNKSFNCFVIDQMMDDFLLDSGFGVVINPTANSADWVLSYGDILNYHLNKEFFTTDNHLFLNRSGKEVITEDEEVLIGQPSELLLPNSTRKLIRELLQNNGIKKPKMLLMMRRLKSGEVSQDLVFNLTQDKFDSESIYHDMMRTITWYLPKHYTIVGTSEKTLKGFDDL